MKTIIILLAAILSFTSCTNNNQEIVCKANDDIYHIELTVLQDNVTGEFTVTSDEVYFC